MSKQTQWLFETPTVSIGKVEREQAEDCPIDSDVTREVVARFPRHQKSVESLPREERAKIDKIASLVVRSLHLRCKPILMINVFGYSDRDQQRGSKFEYQLSCERALEVKKALIKSINNKTISDQVFLQVIPMGAKQPVLKNPKTENERLQNRRVEIVPIVSVMTNPSLNQKVEEILRYIQSEARKKSFQQKTADNSNFSKVVYSRYLQTYLESQNTATAAGAIAAIARQNTSGFVTEVCGRGDFDNWERATPYFNSPFKQALGRIPGFQWLPSSFGGAATEILKVVNRRTLSHIDVPFLLGRHNINWLDCSTREKYKVGQDTDLFVNDTINESQLMHWATGVKYAYLGQERLRELFIGYELWHLEQWDVFGLDPLNDLIAEDAGRYMATQIKALRMNKQNYIDTLNKSFVQARAWVGAMLRLRHNQLDRQIKATIPPSTYFHWQQEISPVSPQHPYQLPSIRLMISNGMPISEVKTSQLVARYIEVYTLLFEADTWEKKNGKISLSLLQRQIVSVNLDSVFRKLAQAEEGKLPASLRLQILPKSRAVAREAESEFGNWFYGCAPCVKGWKICHKPIVPDDNRCKYLAFNTWLCRC
jgi:outer membrane protein OmpA-like peptidoglycan-associated protein